MTKVAVKTKTKTKRKLIKEEHRGRPVDPKSFRQRRLKHWADMRAAGIPVLRGRPKTLTLKTLPKPKKRLRGRPKAKA